MYLHDNIWQVLCICESKILYVSIFRQPPGICRLADREAASRKKTHFCNYEFFQLPPSRSTHFSLVFSRSQHFPLRFQWINFQLHVDSPFRLPRRGVLDAEQEDDVLYVPFILFTGSVSLQGLWSAALDLRSILYLRPFPYLPLPWFVVTRCKGNLKSSPPALMNPLCSDIVLIYLRKQAFPASRRPYEQKAQFLWRIINDNYCLFPWNELYLFKRCNSVKFSSLADKLFYSQLSFFLRYV